jgi:nicotinamide mononucleotide transporter
MDFSLQGITTAFAQMSGWELLAVILGIFYVILAAKESQWAWPFAFFSTLIYTILFWDGALISSSFLNFYYMAMAIYGFMLWKEDEQGETLNISRWPLKQHLLFITVGFMGSIILGYLSETYLEARFAYHDAFVMVFSAIATWMMAKKVLENWLYWILIDSTAIVLYYKSGYLATIVLFVLYVILAFYGYASWRKAYDESRI